LGKGGFGAVYEAEHVSLDRRFAVKILQRHLDADPSFVQRFQREARLTSRLEHAHVIQVTDFGHDERLGTYFVMELLRGEDLQARIKRTGPMDSKTAVGFMRQIVEAFVYAHGKGVVHRDVKSANVFLTSDEGRADFVKVLDFGIARLSDPTAGEGDERLTRTGAVMGSPSYLAPEQALALTVDHRTDIYSLGIVFYEMVTGRVPFTATSAFEIINKQIREAPPAPSAMRKRLPASVRSRVRSSVVAASMAASVSRAAGCSTTTNVTSTGAEGSSGTCSMAERLSPASNHATWSSASKASQARATSAPRP
jgi:serine/threonine-protein kinase